MGKNRSRRSRSYRNATPDVICLPPPRPPRTAPRREPEVERAISLRQVEEPLVTDEAPKSVDYQSRQMRRKAMRAEARAARPRPAKVELPAEPEQTAEPVAACEAEPVEAKAELAPVEAMTVAPLPRNRSLADPNQRLVARLRVWLRSLMRRKRPASAQLPAQPSVEQLLKLQVELAAVQKRLNAILAGVAA